MKPELPQVVRLSPVAVGKIYLFLVDIVVICQFAKDIENNSVRVYLIHDENMWLVGWLISLFNGISTFVGYLMPKLFS